MAYEDKNLEDVKHLFPKEFHDDNGILQIGRPYDNYEKAIELTEPIESANEYPITYSMCRFKIPNISEKANSFRVIYVFKNLKNNYLAKYIEQNFNGHMRRFKKDIDYDAIIIPWYTHQTTSVDTWIKNYYEMLADEGIFTTNHFDDVQDEIIDVMNNE